jgi:hypothetical protein
MTGGSRVAQGATLITTCRADKDTSRKLAPVNTSDKDLDVAKYELCIGPGYGAKRARTDAYCAVMTKDPTANSGNTEHRTPVSVLDTKYNAVATHAGISKVDLSISSYYRDYYDARSEFELFMVYHQISFHRCSELGYTDFNFVDCLNGMVSVDADTCRKHPILFCTDAVYNTLEVKEIHMKNENVKCGIVGSVIALSINTENDVEGLILEVLTNVFEGDYGIYSTGDIKPAVFTPKNPHSAPLQPMQWNFQGFSLGAAHMDVRDGDNVFSVLRSGAMTVRNGPFYVNSGDHLIWVRHAELRCFGKNGYRHARPVATLRAIAALKADGATNAAVDALHNQFTGSVRNSQPVWERGKIDPTGDHTTTLRTYVVAPLKATFATLMQNASIMDKSRRIGTGISNAGPGTLVDILIGSDI